MQKGFAGVISFWDLNVVKCKTSSNSTGHHFVHLPLGRVLLLKQRRI